MPTSDRNALGGIVEMIEREASEIIEQNWNDYGNTAKGAAWQNDGPRLKLSRIVSPT